VTNGRTAILETIRRQLLRARGGGDESNLHTPGTTAGAALPTAHGSVAPSPVQSSADALIDRFAGELTALGGRVHRASTADGVAAAVIAVCRTHRASRLLTWSAEALAIPGVFEALSAAGLSLDTGDLPAGQGRTERLLDLDPIAIGLTGADGAIAESGTIALVSGPGRGRLASLLPPVHIAVVRHDRFYATLPDFLAAHPDAPERGSNLVLVTGPSRTADIEMTLTRGVHGPGEVHVVVAEL
jgi:L-lactate dehydrogenase complex protein LldG